MLRRAARLLLIVLLMGGTSLSAYTHTSCNDNLAFVAEYLYLYPSMDDTYFVITDSSALPTVPPGASGTWVSNDFDFHSGFRVGGKYALCNCERELQVFYTRLFATQTKSVSGNHLWATVGTQRPAINLNNYVGTASSDLELLYQRVDGIFAIQAWNCCAFKLQAEAGLEYAYIRFQEDYVYQATSAPAGFQTVHESCRTWGVGPQFGFASDYRLCSFGCKHPNALYLRGNVTGSLLASKVTLDRADLANFAGVAVSAPNFSSDPTWRMIPVLHARVGLNYDFCFSCFTTSLEVGYEFNSYFRALTRVFMPAANAFGLSASDYYNFDVQGLYVSASFAF